MTSPDLFFVSFSSGVGGVFMYVGSVIAQHNGIALYYDLCTWYNVHIIAACIVAL